MVFKKKLFEIDNFLSIQKICQYALDNSKMIGIIGYPGAGKTWALKHFLKNNLKVNYLKVRPSMKALDFYTRLLELHNPNHRHLRKSLFHVLNNLRNLIVDGEKKLLIIDEAGQFEISELEYIHEFRDLTEESLGIILAGPEYFYDDILDHVERKTPGITEFNRRISMKILPCIMSLATVC